MTIPPPDYREEVDIVTIDPMLLERQRSRYASRGVAYLVLLNGVAALILLAAVSQLTPQVKTAGAVVDAMLVFGVGATTALASTFFAYLRRTLRMQAPERVPLRTGFWWLSVLAALAGAACFLVALSMGFDKGRADDVDFRLKRKKDQRHKDGNEATRRGKDEKSGGGEESQDTSAPSQATPQPLTRDQCQNAGAKWNESTNTCG